MSVHKLTAGSGYDYLTRQVAAQDATERGHTGLASYYTARGESPGVWVGSGMADLGGLAAGDPVTEEQMRNLFGSGRHPLAEQLRAAAADAGLDVRAQDRAAWLGTPYRVYAGDVSLFRRMVAARVAALNTERGLPADAPGTVDDRARVRTEVGVELFRAEFGRDPVDARELAGAVARHSRPRTTAVAGYDLTFSPVKSVSTLWAIADEPTAAVIEAAHRQAVADALAYLEQHALFTREGTDGVRQVETTGLIAAAFTHRDSRAGDPDLHTHVAVANKVKAKVSGKWLAIDGRLVYKANIAASETYNTRLEHHLTQSLGVRFAERTDGDPRKRPVREIVGVDPRLNQFWSSRRAGIQARREVLTQEFQAAHGRPPSPIESIKLAQQATLETREAKHEPRSLAEQRTAWAREARQVLGGRRAVTAMVASVLSPRHRSPDRVDTAWLTATAASIHDTLQASRSHWQSWHVQAEALRRIRNADLPTVDLDRVVGLLVDEVLTRRSVALTRPGDDIPVPAALARSDGTSVYTIANSALYTSAELLAAEARIVTRAGQHDGTRIPAHTIDTAMHAGTGDGVALNAGQAALVREMAGSGARVQLAIAPAGAGKTTAMRALAAAWTRAGGQVLGLAPSAAAAKILGTHLDATTDTLAKLAWHLDHPDTRGLPEWAARIGPGTLVVIDEAGMADTLSLDTVIEHVVAAGGSVRLVGDDQQLAAVGAGGVLRDIAATHGALHLTELIRFTDPAEGAASLALRDGLPEALGFYLDKGRVHVGDLATITDTVFTAWRTDRDTGRDAIMLAPTRELVAELNQRARAHRLATTTTAAHQATVSLADGNHASVGDLVITRSNDRSLRIAATDWVKNGDRWHITGLGADGTLTVRHTRNGRFVTLPAAYVTGSVELGYASTIHTAQGVTADTSHTVLTGTESRQVAYTALTRGRDGNHLYLQVVGDGDPHNVIRPDHTHPPTATDLLEQVLARDDASRSATTTRRDAEDPAVLLGQAVARYVDSLYLAAETRLGADQVARLEQAADQVVPDLTAADAWPTLRAHLVLAAAHGLDPVRLLHAAAEARGLDTADDPAAVIDWRLDDTGLRGIRPDRAGSHAVGAHGGGAGPLPWLPGIPEQLAEDPEWGRHLAARAARVRDLTGQVKDQVTTATGLPSWARQGQGKPSLDLLVDVAVWRAATGVDPADRRPTGPRQAGTAARRWQAGLTARFAGDRSPALAEWRDLFDEVLVHPRQDPFTPLLAERLAALGRAGLDAPAIVARALADGPLPDDHAAAALWWRIAEHLSPAVATHVEHDQPLNTAWADRLPDLLGAQTAAALRESGWWPTLVTVLEHAAARGTNLPDLLTGYSPTISEDPDPCQALVWRLSVLNDPPPPEQDRATWPYPDPPLDLDQLLEADRSVPAWPDDQPPGWAPTEQEWADLRPLHDDPPPDPDAEPLPVDDFDRDGAAQVMDDEEVDDAVLAWAARARAFAGSLEPTDQQVAAALDRAYDADTAPVSPARILELNQLALDYYTTRLPGSWAQAYLTARAGTDLTGDPHLRPGYAPAGWTSLVTHLRALGVTDVELTESGLASTTRDGRLIDRFRDRLVLPITRLGQTGQLETLGFVGRRHPQKDGPDAGPKYLNTPDTPLFHKGAQLYTVREDLLATGATPVLVEGPMDALAVTLAGDGRYVGVAPLGTALTEDQAAQLARYAHEHHQAPVVATDADLPGQVAAQRDYWMLAQHNLSPQTITLRPGSDPADLLATHGPDALRQVLETQTPLTEALLAERLEHLDGLPAARAALLVLAAGDPAGWEGGIARIADRTGIPAVAVRRDLAAAVRRWDADPRMVTTAQLGELSSVRDRITSHVPATQAAPKTTATTRPRPSPARVREATPSGPSPRR